MAPSAKNASPGSLCVISNLWILFSLIKSKLTRAFSSSVPHPRSLHPSPSAMSIFTGPWFCPAVPYSVFLWQVLCTHHFCPLWIFHFPRNFPMLHVSASSSSLSYSDTLLGVWRFDHLVFFNPKFWTVSSLDQLFVTNPFTDFRKIFSVFMSLLLCLWEVDVTKTCNTMVWEIWNR